MIQTLTEFFRNLKGVVSEPVRATIVRRFCRAMTIGFRQHPRLAINWGEGEKFAQACQIQDGCVAVSDDLDVTATDLSKFCDHWLSVAQYREPGGEWVPFTPDMHSVRVTIIKGLEEIAAKKLAEEA